MRAVVQRVLQASVTVVEANQREVVSSIGSGLLILVGVGVGDGEDDARSLADKIAHLRVMEDDGGKLNLSLMETGGEALVISNFTLYGDCRRGRRPSFLDAASGPSAVSLYQRFGAALAAYGVPVQYGRFGAQMEVALINDGPITLLLDSHRAF